MTSLFDNLRSRKSLQDGDVDVAFTDPAEGVELKEYRDTSAESRDNEAHHQESEGEELTDQEVGDQKSLIDSEGGIDSDGVVREYEVALKHLGFGFFHILLLLINGTALLSDAIEVLSISFVLPILNKPEEFGVGDSEEAVLASVIFIGMLFGSYIWGSMADIVGRRTTLVSSLTISAIFGFISAFSPWFWLFVLLRFFSGFGVGGSLPVIFPYTSEFIRNKYRGPYLGVQSVFWMVGRFLCGAFAWAIIPRGQIDLPLGGFRFHSWRLFIAVSALPSLIGAVMYFFLPESPRFLLEVGKQEKALKNLRLAYKVNHPISKQEYPVRSILLENRRTIFSLGKESRLTVFLDRCVEILWRTRDLFRLKFWRVTPPLLAIMFCLSFGSYGITLWYPTYVTQLTEAENAAEFKEFCLNNNSVITSGNIAPYCNCSGTDFADFAMEDVQLENFVINDVVFRNVSFLNVNFTSVMFNGTTFINCYFSECDFYNTYFNATHFDDADFDSVSFQSSTMCSMNGSNVVMGEATLLNVNVNGKFVNATFDTSLFSAILNLSDATCEVEDLYGLISCGSSDEKVYRDSFIISASAFPGNVASAFAVYFLRRNYWMAFSLFASTLSAFLLYVSNAEVFVVIMLCIFTAVSTPAWNDSSLLIAELYPTHLRSTAAGIHLLVARIGAIFGINIFGVFIRVNPSVPILLVASILFVGGVAALVLPKTTRKTLLK